MTDFHGNATQPCRQCACDLLLRVLIILVCSLSDSVSFSSLTELLSSRFRSCRTMTRNKTVDHMSRGSAVLCQSSSTSINKQTKKNSPSLFSLPSPFVALLSFLPSARSLSLSSCFPSSFSLLFYPIRADFSSLFADSLCHSRPHGAVVCSLHPSPFVCTLPRPVVLLHASRSSALPSRSHVLCSNSSLYSLYAPLCW